MNDLRSVLESLRQEYREARVIYEHSQTEMQRLEWAIAKFEKHSRNGKPGKSAKAAKGTKGTKPAKAASESAPVGARLNLKAAVFESMRVLGEFTERDLNARIRKLYPHIEFNVKSLRKPTRQARDDGSIRKIKEHQGNKSQAVWAWVNKVDKKAA